MDISERPSIINEMFDKNEILINNQVLNDFEYVSESVINQNPSDESKSDEEEQNENSDESLYEDIEINCSQKLYTGASLSIFQFNIIFMSLISILNLSETHSNSLFEFIRLILPQSHTLPGSYYLFKRCFSYNMINEIKLCHICKLKLTKKCCPSDSCVSKNNSVKENTKKSIKVVVANLKSQLLLILKRHYFDMINYKSN